MGGVTHHYTLLLLLPYLCYRDEEDEPRRGAVGVAVKVPLAVHLAGQGLVSHVADQPLGEAQAHLLPQGAVLQLPAPLEDGPPEAVRAFAAHLEGRGETHGYFIEGSQKVITEGIR